MGPGGDIRGWLKISYYKSACTSLDATKSYILSLFKKNDIVHLGIHHFLVWYNFWGLLSDITVSTHDDWLACLEVDVCVFEETTNL